MQYGNEFHFLQRILQQLRLQTTLLHADEEPAPDVDYGLRSLLGKETDYSKNFKEILEKSRECTIYRWLDPYGCRYLSFCLPGMQRRTILLIGPFLNAELTHEQLMEEAESFAVPPQMFRRIENLYGRIPVISDDTTLMAVVDAFGACIWGEEAYSVLDLNQERTSDFSVLKDTPEREAHNVVMEMRLMEERYRSENELLQAVSEGQLHKAERIVAGMSWLEMERRIPDTLRNYKNYLIVLNTLLRKAAEKGGVHPLALDRQSSGLARRIENLSSAGGVKTLMPEMIRSYCRLVRKYASPGYSAPVQAAVDQIRLDLTADLSLKALAARQNLNASYLSAQFKKETGQTVTEYVNQMRVERAQYLLAGTRLQIQTIAQHCGISDVNYFAKVFKKQTGRTPREYRQLVRNRTSEGESR